MADEITDDLAVLLERYPLPEGMNDEPMSLDEMAQFLNLSTTSMGQLVKEPSFPVIERGGHGRPYRLRPSHCWAWNKARLDADHDRQRAAARNIELAQATFLGLDVEDGGEVLSAADRRKLAEADIMHNKAAQMRRQLVPLGEVLGMLESTFAVIRNGCENLPDRLERELALKPEEVAAVARAVNDTLTEMARGIEEAELAEREIGDVDLETQLLI